MGNIIVELSTEEDSLKNQSGFYYGKRFEECKAKLLKQRSIMKKEQILFCLE